jgi:hypothetical protein
MNPVSGLFRSPLLNGLFAGTFVLFGMIGPIPAPPAFKDTDRIGFDDIIVVGKAEKITAHCLVGRMDEHSNSH